jgi:hypothetical protein
MTTPEMTHTPHPGSRLDSVATAAAQTAPTSVPDEQVGTVSGTFDFVVPTAEVLPALGRGYVVVLSAANPVLRVLPQDPLRRGAVVLAIDNDVYLGSDLDGVQQAAGGTAGTTAGYLPAGIAVPISAKNTWFAGATTASNVTTSSRVSVWIFLDDE